MSENDKKQDQEQTQQKIEIRGPTLKAGPAGMFMAMLHRSILSDAQSRADDINTAIEKNDLDALETFSKDELVLDVLTPDVIKRLQIHLTAHFQTGINREVLFDCLLKAVKEKDHVAVPRSYKPKTSIKAIEEVKEKLTSYFDPVDEKAFKNSEKGQLTRSFNKAKGEDPATHATIKWVESIYKTIAESFDTAWQAQHDISISNPEFVFPENVTGLETDSRFSRSPS